MCYNLIKIKRLLYQWLAIHLHLTTFSIWSHQGSILNRPIIDEATKSVVHLVNILNFLEYDWMKKINERLLEMTPYGIMLDSSVSLNQIKSNFN